jgi:hypothetical protein
MRSLHSVLAVLVVGLLLSFSAGPFAWASVIPCNPGVIQDECPTDYPICCAWPEDGVIAACCPSGSQCDLNDGLCVQYQNSSTGDGQGQHLVVENGINLSIGAAAGLLSFSILVFMLILIVVILMGCRCHILLERRRRQALAEEERQRMLAAQAREQQEDEEAGHVGEADDDDDEGLCKICFVRTSDCVLLECGHVCCCWRCGGKCKVCPICRSDVKRRLRLESVPVRRAKREKGVGMSTALAEKMKLNAIGTGEKPSSQISEPVATTAVSPEAAVQGDHQQEDASAAESDTRTMGVGIPIPPAVGDASHLQPPHLPPLRVSDIEHRSGSTDTDSGGSTEELLTVRRITGEE